MLLKPQQYAKKEKKFKRLKAPNVTPTAPQNKILVIEDSTAPMLGIDRAIRSIFQTKEYDIATTLQDVFEKTPEKKYDIILLDDNLPYTEQDQPKSIGYKAIPKIRKIHPNTPIIGTSATAKKHPDLDATITKQFGETVTTLHEAIQTLNQH